MEMKDQKRAVELAEKRMRMIAPLLNPNVTPAIARRLRRQLSGEWGVSERTLERYCQRYREEGFEGLKPKGKARAELKISPELLDAAIAMRRERPERSVPSMIKELEREGLASPGFLKRSTLQDALARAGFAASTVKRYHMQQSRPWGKDGGRHRDLWMGYSQENLGPWVFYCVVDHATGYVVHGGFYERMGQKVVEDALRQAFRAHGLPHRLYLAPGWRIRIGWMRQVCRHLGVRLLHVRPGMGVNERCRPICTRFWEQLEGNIPETLEGLNQRFQNWLQQVYHATVQAPLECSPEQAFQRTDGMRPRVDEGLLSQTFLHRERRRVDARGYISFQGQKLAVGVHLAGQHVQVVYDAAYGDKLTVEGEGVAPVRIRMPTI